MSTDAMRAAKPVAWLRVSNISGHVTGVFEAGADGSAPDVQLRTERLEPLYTAPPASADRLSAENAALRTNYETACKLVADMHAAAMGAKVGPVVGVVEDVLRLRAEVEELRAENFALAAGQCVNATADEGGRPYCKELAALRAEVARLKTVPMKYRRMEFNAQLQQENAELRAAIDAMRGGGK